MQTPDLSVALLILTSGHTSTAWTPLQAGETATGFEDMGEISTRC